jgi:carbamoyl-phosphate synthase large subunit
VGHPLKELLSAYWPYPLRPGDRSQLENLLHTHHRAPTPWPTRASVKEVVLPFGRFEGADVLLGPEMRSTGEVMSFGESFPESFAKAQIAAGNPLPTSGTVLVSLADPDKREGTSLMAQLSDMGFDIVATRGTARVLEAMGIPAKVVLKVGEGRPDCVDVIVQDKVDLVVNTPSSMDREGRTSDVGAGADPLTPANATRRGVPLPWSARRTSGYRIRTAALQHHVPYVTTLVALRATVAAIRYLRARSLTVSRLNEVAPALEENDGRS